MPRRRTARRNPDEDEENATHQVKWTGRGGIIARGLTEKEAFDLAMSIAERTQKPVIVYYPDQDDETIIQPEG